MRNVHLKIRMWDCHRQQKRSRAARSSCMSAPFIHSRPQLLSRYSVPHLGDAISSVSDSQMERLQQLLEGRRLQSIDQFRSMIYLWGQDLSFSERELGAIRCLSKTEKITLAAESERCFTAALKDLKGAYDDTVSKMALAQIYCIGSKETYETLDRLESFMQSQSCSLDMVVPSTKYQFLVPKATERAPYSGFFRTTYLLKEQRGLRQKIDFFEFHMNPMYSIGFEKSCRIQLL